VHVHIPLPTALLLLVYTAALAVAATRLGTAGIAGGVVLAGLVLRGLLRARHNRVPTASPGVAASARVGFAPVLAEEAPATAA
jgi:hypothetical protein